MHAKKVCQKSTVAHRACWKTLRQINQSDISIHFEKAHFDFDIDILSADPEKFTQTLQLCERVNENYPHALF